MARQMEAQRRWSESWQEQVRKHGSGWYFARLYDERDDLIDSLDFRYVEGLKDIDNELSRREISPRQRLHFN